MSSVYVVGRDKLIEDMFTKRGWAVTDDMNKANLVQFTGGEDVTPKLYGEDAHYETRNNIRRDLKELRVFFRALAAGIPMAGICRGGQFLHVCGGGKLRQHVKGPLGNHAMISDDGKWDDTVTSTHHQVMDASLTGEVLFWSYVAGARDEEVVYHEHIKALCFQPHPEYDGVPECTNLYFELLYNLFGLQ